jgi:hypothetical protein
MMTKKRNAHKIDHNQSRPLKNRSTETSNDKKSKPKRDPFFNSFKKKETRQSKAPKAKRKVYRRTKRLRPCTLRTIFLLPILILLLERYFGRLLKVEHFADFYYDQSGIEPWKIDSFFRDRVGIPPDIFNLTSPLHQQINQCPRDLRKITSSSNNHRFQYMRSRKIPLIIHQSSKSNCLTMNFHKAAMKWAGLRGWSFFFHDENAVDNLLQSSFPEFPHLKHVAQNCVISHSTKNNLWKYLVLWSYGGVVASLNSYPEKFHASTIERSDDGFFMLDPAKGVLRTSLMAVSPRHPLMYYAIQQSLANILKAKNIGAMDNSMVTGYGALNQALFSFRGLEDQGNNSVNEGKIGNIEGRSIRVVSAADDYATPVYISDRSRVSLLSDLLLSSRPSNNLMSLQTC